MRKVKSVLVLCALLGVCTSSVYAQDSTQVQTLFSGNGKLKPVGFMLSPNFSFTNMDGASASVIALRAGLILNNKLTIGGFYNASMNQIQPETETVQGVYMDYRAAGGFLEYTLYSDKLVHVTFPLFIGGGEVEMDNENGSAGLGEQGFFLIEPSAMLEVNLHKNLRFNVGAGYRIVNEMSYRNFDQSALSGLTGYVGLKFGIF